ncbi:gluconokinase [Paraflavitalea pollutisoli]|uniref:gluconokinase n=1 Tax=Paraflavitalea pollutisoli TaxID=3034143 RepID=UPI0023EAA5AA|nr:gluconokinase [Paraflavitalea sp. H1-2-19X]
MSTKQATYLIGVDIGTTNTKAIAFDGAGNPLAQANITYSPLPTAAGTHELDPETLFDAVVTSIRGVVDAMTTGSLLGISFSSAMHSLLAVDKAGKPLTNLITWADLRSSAQAAALRDTAAGQHIYQHTGTPIHPMSPLCKLRWMQEQEPALFERAQKFIGIKELVFFRFFNQYLIDYGVASATGLFDIYAKTWYPEALAYAGIGVERLSTPVSPTAIIRGMDPAMASQLGIDAQTPLVPGGSDGCLAQIGSGALRTGDLSLTIGTSGAVRMLSQQPRHDPQARIFNYVLTEEWFVSGGPVNNGGVLLKWYAAQFLERSFTHSEDFDWFLQRAAQVPAGAEGLIFLPYVQGERAPVWDAAAKGVFFGLQATHGQAHAMRAVVEGINFSLYEVAQSIEETIAPIDHVYASGGFTKSTAWLQWLTDLFDKPVTVSSTADASATGAAILGYQALGLMDTLAFAGASPAAATTYYPQETSRIAYLRNYEKYRELYHRLKDLFLPAP